jgi:hypothetical protein
MDNDFYSAMYGNAKSCLNCKNADCWYEPQTRWEPEYYGWECRLHLDNGVIPDNVPFDETGLAEFFAKDCQSYAYSCRPNLADPDGLEY